MLEIDALRVTYGDTVAVDDVDLRVGAGEVVTLLGPSGCGKSSLLRAVAGLEPCSGAIHLDGRDLARVPPHERGVGLMFQGEALFPHRDVAGNVGFGLRMQRRSPDEIADRVAWALELVGLPGTGSRSVETLSGGEQQRVALARAIAPGPRLLMLDEPLSSVDRALRDRLMEELPHVFAEVDAAVVYVTHDQEEALALADRVAVMRAGRVVQEGPPPEVWQSPTSRFVATFLGLRVVEGEVRDGVARTPLGRSPAPDHPDGPVTIAVLPGAIRPADEGDRPAQPLEATVEARRFAGDHVVVVARTGDGIAVEVAWRGAHWPAPGEVVDLAVDAGRLVVVGRD